MKMTAWQAAQACGGELLCGDPQTPLTSFFTDSREVCTGGMFVPLKGERTDAHIFIEATLQAGAAGTLTQMDIPLREDRVVIRVKDTLYALQEIGAWWRSQFSIPVIGVTGSVGKTTTKEMIALALSASFSVMRTRGNQNSQVGMPLTLFQLEEEHDCAVVEMGMSNFGEMARLSEISRPTMAVMTNIGISHIAYLKTQENILREKLHITDRFGPDQFLFVNGDDPLLRRLEGEVPLRVVTFGLSEGCQYRAVQVEMDETGVRFLLQTPRGVLPMSIPVPGEHNVRNAAVSIAVTEALGGDVEKAALALSHYEPPAMRQQIFHAGGVTVVDDTYNASPDSVHTAVQLLARLGAQGRKIAVLADMLELGEKSYEGHYDCGAFCAENGVNMVIAVGEESAATAQGARETAGSHPVEVYHCENNEQAIGILKKQLLPGDTVLVKGSRGMHMEEIVRELLQ
ncbi:MAG: UDP-N-acetylmuramoyl-tripeptide--D-alanyl-D-alanine ligase [Clostridia bacterium]|nr:UDP-N-acetylmuramoyl-tripeptide--D-alanyl-D-alanine ligase [Clostridia bacterium]